MRELDVLLGGWLEEDWPCATPALRAAFEALLAEEDDRIWDWLMDRASPPTELTGIVVAVRDYPSRRSVNIPCGH